MVRRLKNIFKTELFQDMTGKLADATNMKASLYLLALAALFFSVLYLSLGLNYLAVSNFTTALLLFGIERLLHFEKLKREIIVNLTLVVSYLHIFNVSATSGGSESPAVAWFILVPIAAAFFSGVLAFWFFVLIFALTFPILKLVELFPFIKIAPFPPEQYFPIQASSFAGVAIITIFGVYCCGRNFYKNFQELKESKEHMAELVRLLTHDIAGPISVIRAYNQYLSSPHISSELFHKAIQGIDKNSKVIECLIVKVREYKALESGKRVIKTTPSDLRECMAKSLEMIKEKCEEKDIQIQFAHQGNDFSALVEPEILTLQVLPNILSNALKFSYPKNTIWISINSDQQSVNIDIIDKGIGIPQVLLNDIFSFDKSTSRVGTSGEPGTGFGMPLVKSFVEKMQGRISIESSSKDDNASSSGTKVSLQFKKSDSSSALP